MKIICDCGKEMFLKLWQPSEFNPEDGEETVYMELYCDQCGASFTGTYEAGKDEIKLPVTYCGWQEQTNKPPMLLVNTPAHSTVSYDAGIHCLSESEKQKAKKGKIAYDNKKNRN